MHAQERAAPSGAVQIDGPVGGAGQEHVRPTRTEAEAVDGAVVWLVAVEILLTVGYRTSMDLTLLGARDIGRGVTRYEVEAESRGLSTDPTFALNHSDA